MASAAQPQTVSPQFMELVGRALTDTDFRDRLFTDREAAASEYTLTDIDEKALDELTREQLEEQAEVLTHASDLTISIKISVKF